jgi:MarR family transcriptional regulator, transcriptional regulator for hemolysin
MLRAPEEQIGYLLKRLMHVFRHELEARLRQSTSMSFAHLVTLDQIQQEPGVPGAQLARRLLVTAQTMTGLLRRLEKEGSIERRPDPANRRADRWYLLPKGQERLGTARAAGGPVMTQMLSLLSGQEIGQLRHSLEKCVEGLESANRCEAGEPVQSSCLPMQSDSGVATYSPKRGISRKPARR